MSDDARLPNGSESLGWAIRAQRLEKGLRQRDLAERAALDATWISRIETGKVDSPRYLTLRRIAEALDLTAEKLLAQAHEYESGVRTRPANRRARPER